MYEKEIILFLMTIFFIVTNVFGKRNANIWYIINRTKICKGRERFTHRPLLLRFVTRVHVNSSRNVSAAQTPVEVRL